MADLAQGSALIMCLIFMTALSTIALSALEAAWSGQRMISAYVSHQQTFLELETELQKGEEMVWQQIRSSGLAEVLSHAQSIQNPQTGVITSVYGEWIGAEFTQQRCGPLFEVNVLPGNGFSSHLKLSARWDVCCASTERCMASEFIMLRRLWSRSAADPISEL